MNILKILTPKRIIGNFGERQATKLLRKKGYKILEQNFTANNAEIDIIASRDGITVFVEVKTRSIKSLGQWETRPASSVTPEKQRKIIRASSEFMRTRRLSQRMRYDVVEVYLENRKNKKRVKEIKHLLNTFDISTAYSRHFSNSN
jgi:putative endonuclease